MSPFFIPGGAVVVRKGAATGNGVHLLHEQVCSIFCGSLPVLKPPLALKLTTVIKNLDQLASKTMPYLSPNRCLRDWYKDR